MNQSLLCVYKNASIVLKSYFFIDKKEIIIYELIYEVEVKKFFLIAVKEKERR
jgi:hypothetical protein